MPLHLFKPLLEKSDKKLASQGKVGFAEFQTWDHRAKYERVKLKLVNNCIMTAVSYVTYQNHSALLSVTVGLPQKQNQIVCTCIIQNLVREAESSGSCFNGLCEADASLSMTGACRVPDRVSKRWVKIDLMGRKQDKLKPVWISYKPKDWTKLNPVSHCCYTSNFGDGCVLQKELMLNSYLNLSNHLIEELRKLKEKTDWTHRDCGPGCFSSQPQERWQT